MGTMIIFALSYNMLLGQTGLLSFGHAVYYGLGGFVAIHAMNAVIHAKLGVPVAVIPLVGGLAGLGFGFLFGLVSTKRAGIVFSMISLGIGELVSSSSFILRTLLRRRGGDHHQSRQAGAAVRASSSGRRSRSIISIAVWCFVCVVAMYALTRTPFGRMCNAVRDNPERVEFVGYPPRMLRLIAFCFAAFFAGIAGGLAAINFEIMNSQQLGAQQSSLVLLDGLYRRRRLFRRADRRRGDHHIPADHPLRRFERLAALFRPDVHRRRALCARRRRRLADVRHRQAALRRGAGGSRLPMPSWRRRWPRPASARSC